MKTKEKISLINTKIRNIARTMRESKFKIVGMDRQIRLHKIEKQSLIKTLDMRGNYN